MSILRIWYWDDPATHARTYRSWRHLRFTRSQELNSSIRAIVGITDIRVINNGYLKVFIDYQYDRDIVQSEVARCIAGNIPWGTSNPICGLVFKRLPRMFIRRY
jgi:hypothetical protein